MNLFFPLAVIAVTSDPFDISLRINCMVNSWMPGVARKMHLLRAGAALLPATKLRATFSVDEG
jgi:hypothetical protein